LNGWTPLHWAIHRQNAPIIDFLLISGADPRLRNSDLKSSLDLAASQPECVRRVFIERGFEGQLLANDAMQMERRADDRFQPNYIRVPDISPELRAVEQHQTVLPVTSTVLAPVKQQDMSLTNGLSQSEEPAMKKRRSSDNLVQLSADPIREILVYNQSGAILGSVVISLGSTGEQLKEMIIEVSKYSRIYVFLAYLSNKELEQPADCQLAKYVTTGNNNSSNNHLTVPISAKQMQKRIGELFPPDVISSIAVAVIS
jgi:hypothetical protein